MQDPVNIIEREEIKTILPHREPMLLVDRVEKTAENEATGRYTVKGDEWFLQGHFPENPVVPGVILCEIMAQSCCVLLADTIKGHTPYFTGLNNVKFRKKVFPGDVIEVKCNLTNQKPPFYFAVGKSYVNGQLVAGAEFSFMVT